MLHTSNPANLDWTGLDRTDMAHFERWKLTKIRMYNYNEITYWIWSTTKSNQYHLYVPFSPEIAARYPTTGKGRLYLFSSHSKFSGWPALKRMPKYFHLSIQWYFYRDRQKIPPVIDCVSSRTHSAQLYIRTQEDITVCSLAIHRVTFWF